MSKLIGREIRYTRASYFLFVWGILFIPFFVVNFVHETDSIMAFVFSGLTALIIAVLFNVIRTKMSFGMKFFIFFLVLSALNLLIWLTFCEGTFIYKS